MPLKNSLPPLAIPDVTIQDYILQQMVQYGDDTALIESETNTTYTYREVGKLTLAIAQGLQAAGLRKNDVALLAVPNSPNYVLVLLGVLRAGGIVSGVNLEYTKYELIDRIKDCQPKFIFSTIDYFSRVVRPALAECQHETVGMTIYTTEESTAHHQLPPPLGCASFATLLQFSDDYPNFRLERPQIDVHEDVALLPYSSGTTGKPKGVMITHYNMVACMANFGDYEFFMVPRRRESMLLNLPMYHAMGQLTTLHSLKAGCRMVTMQRFDKALYMQNIQEYRVPQLFLVPPIMLMLTKDPLVAQYDLSSVKWVLVGGAPAGQQICNDFKKRHPNVDFIIQGYGMTEITSGAIRNFPRKDLPMGSVGVLLRNTEAKVVDVSSGRELGPNEDGEILLKSGAVMKGYWKRPDATAAALEKDGFLHTGDIGHYDEWNNFFVVDRLKELIKVKGFQVPPAELEDLLLSHPGIREVAVVGIPDAAAGELPKAFVVKKLEANTLTIDQVKKFVEERVARYKRLSVVEFVDEIPRSASGKILRRYLKEAEMKKAKLNSKL